MNKEMNKKERKELRSEAMKAMKAMKAGRNSFLEGFLVSEELKKLMQQQDLNPFQKLEMWAMPLTKNGGELLKV